MSEICLSSSDNVGCVNCKKCKSCVEANLFYIERISVHDYYKHLHPSLAQPEVPVHEDRLLSSRTLRLLKSLRMRAFLCKYGIPSIPALKTIIELLFKNSTEISMRAYGQHRLLKTITVGLLYFWVIVPFIQYLPLLKVNEALTTDLQDPQLAQYRRRLFTNMPEAFNVRYLQDKELRRFDGTLPEEEPDEVAVGNSKMSSELKLDEVSN
mmetsp:Transcript_20123/g.37413  ORF Transcript_20123/g.37413 Transcript_20123/m.37413 type:complete len:210 (-) Transcript_20123:1624-2253(-)